MPLSGIRSSLYTEVRVKHKHTILLILLGWLIGAFFPPQAALSLVKGKKAAS